MDFAYNDILGMARPVHTDDVFSRRHPRMTQLNRAKLFAPFSALSGFEEAVRAKEVPYVPRHIPDAQEIRALDMALNRLSSLAGTGAQARRSRITVRVEYFEVCVDPHSDAFGRLGLYHTRVGMVRRIDPAGRTLWVEDLAIPFSDLRSVTDPQGDPLFILIDD